MLAFFLVIFVTPFLVFSTQLKIGHNYETKSESSDSLDF